MTRVPTDAPIAGEEPAEGIRRIAEQSSDMLMIIDSERVVRWENAACARVLGFPRGSVLGTDPTALVHPDDLPALLSEIGPMIEQPCAIGSFEYRVRAADGAWHSLETTATNLLHEPEVAGTVLSMRDVTGQREAEKALQETERRYRDLFEHAMDGIVIADVSGNITAANAAYVRMLGYSREELASVNMFDLIAPEEIEGAQQAFERRDDMVEMSLIAKDGSRVFVQCTARFVLNADGEPVGLEAIVRDRTEQRQLQDQLEYQAFHDALTQLPNRLLFLDRLDQALARAGRGGSFPTVMLLDLDGFKAVNDTYGHKTGDELLRKVATILQGALRPSDTVARFGGDEFVILAEGDNTQAGLDTLAERILATLHTPFQLTDGAHQISGSLGITTATTGSTADQLLNDADTAMYNTKTRGPGGHHTHHHTTLATPAP
ncbi:MAG: diguanylate cyclase [Gaiellales bacterium]